MTPTEAIPGYAGHADAAARRLSDQQVRALVGERLAALRERLPDATAGDAFEDLLAACEFGDQRIIKAVEHARYGEADAIAPIEAADVELAGLSAGANDVSAADAGALIASIAATLARRTATILALER